MLYNDNLYVRPPVRVCMCVYKIGEERPGIDGRIRALFNRIINRPQSVPIVCRLFRIHFCTRRPLWCTRRGVSKTGSQREGFQVHCAHINARRVDGLKGFARAFPKDRRPWLATGRISVERLLMCRCCVCACARVQGHKGIKSEGRRRSLRRIRKRRRRKKNNGTGEACEINWVTFAERRKKLHVTTVW